MTPYRVTQLTVRIPNVTRINTFVPNVQIYYIKIPIKLPSLGIY